MILEKIIRLVLNVFVAIYVARYLGPEQFGILNYAISFVVLFSAFATLGLDGVVVRNLVTRPEERDLTLGTAFGLKLFGSVLLVGFVLLGLQFTSSDSQTKWMVAIIAGGMIFKTVGVVDFFFQATVQAQFNTVSQFCAALLSTLVQIALIQFQASLVWFAVAIVFENFILGIAQFVTYSFRRLSATNWRFDLRCARKLIKDSWPLLLSGIMVMIYMRIDQVMIKEILSYEMVGNYAAAVRLSEAWYFIPMAITASVFPAVMNAKKINGKMYFERLQQLFDLMLWIALIIAIPTTLFSAHAVRILYGEEYLLAGNVLTIHIWSGVFVFLGVASNKYLLAENLVLVSFFQTAIGCIANIILNLILIPKMGIIGAAWATFVSYGIAVLCLFWNKRSKLAFGMILKSFFPFARAIRAIK
jgi:O-antigen/teichoic acid export membrane protein